MSEVDAHARQADGHPPPFEHAQAGQRRAEPGDAHARRGGQRDASYAPGGPILEMRGITKTFGTVRALSGVSFAAWPGEVHALMGENGAGKSTLMKVLSGVYQADLGGAILIDGQPVRIDRPLAAKALGVVTIYQELALSPNLTVAENIYLGREPRRGPFVDRRAMQAACTPVLQRLGVPFKATTLVARLSIAEQQLVEIARALAANSRILVMDEPTTSLTARETDRLFALVKQLRDEGLAIIYISHRMAEIDELADRISVIRDGASVGTLRRDELTPGAVIRMMVGRDLSTFYKKEHKADQRNEVLLSVRDVADGSRVHGCGFDLHAGEVLGISGLVGAGRTEFARLICGIDPRKRGTILLQGKAIAARNPAEVIDQGIVYLTEDRKALGLYLDMTVRENVNIGVIEQDAAGGVVLDFAAARRRSGDSVQRLGVRAGSDTVNIGSLSGGNQQKVLLGRLLETRPRVLILDEPTRGIDIGAKSEIYRLIDELARAGMGVVVISSEMAEIIGICDRTLVMRDGHIAGELLRPITQEAIMAIVAGVEQAA